MLRIALIGLLLSLPFGAAHAAPGDGARAAIQKLAPMQQVEAFRKSALPGYYEGVIAGQVVYASEDGTYVIRGQVDNVATGANLTEDSMAARRLDTLATIGADMRLTYAPPNPRYRVTVFTDIDCPFCRRLHAQMADYNQLGIAIDYLFFPLSIHPDANRKSNDVWCANDRKAAYDAVMNGHALDRLTCDTPVVKTIKAGADIGVSATPTAIGPDGRVISSAILMTPHRLLAELQKTPVAVAAEVSP